MPIPIDAYEVLEDILGKENARKLAHVLEDTSAAETMVRFTALRDEFLQRWDSLLQRWEQWSEHVVTKGELRAAIEMILSKIEQLNRELRGEMQRVETELREEIWRVNLKMNSVLILLVLLLTVMNPTFTELIRVLFRNV